MYRHPLTHIHTLTHRDTHNRVTYTDTHLHIYTHSHTHAHTHTYVLTNLHIHIEIHIHTHTYVLTNLHILTHKDTHTHLHTQTLTYIPTSAYTHRHTHTHFDNLNPPLFLPLYTWDLFPMKLSRRVSFHTLKLPSTVLDIDTIQICLGSGGISPSYTLLVGMQICLTFWRPLDNIHRNFQVHSNLLSEIYLIYMFHQPPKVQAQEYLLMHHLREMSLEQVFA